MNKKLLVNRMFLLASFLTIMLGASIVATNGHVFAAKNIWDDDDTMEELVKDIDNGKDDDDDMDLMKLTIIIHHHHHRRRCSASFRVTFSQSRLPIRSCA